MSRTGGCYCGEIKYTLNDDATSVVVCYCDTCKRLATSQTLNIQTSQDKVTVTQGKPKEYLDNKTDSGKPMHRFFCGTCGSCMWADPEATPGVRYLKVGTLDNLEGLNLAAEIYVEKALPHELTPKGKFGQKQFEGMLAKEV